MLLSNTINAKLDNKGQCRCANCEVGRGLHCCECVGCVCRPNALNKYWYALIQDKEITLPTLHIKGTCKLHLLIEVADGR